MGGHGDVDDSPCVDGHKDQHVARGVVPEVLGGHVHGEDAVGVRGDELAPVRGLGPIRSDQVAPDAGGRDGDTQLELQLQGDAIFAPFGVVARDALDDGDRAAMDGRATR